MPQVLTTPQLTKYVENLILRIPSVDFKFTNYASFLYATGLRPSDFHNPDFFVSQDATTITIKPPKNNNHRILQKSAIPPDILHYILTGNGIYSRKDYKTMLKRFSMYMSRDIIKVGSRNLDLYLFRYAYVRQLYESGMTITEIKIDLGWKNISIANSYLFRDIILF